MDGIRRIHSMPFGTHLRDDGKITFRLWAPAAAEVELCLQGDAPEVRLHMAAEDAGWFGITTELAGPGFYYQYLIDGQHYVPDPASRYQPQHVDGSSQVIDPAAYAWQDGDWKGGTWENTVFYELHVGTFSETGTFAGVRERLDYLADLGVTAIQLMPVADFCGRRNWGYDGVLPFAPASCYGSPDDLKALVDAAHARGLRVFIDVVYNHFGPDGNLLHHYAPDFFTRLAATAWGEAINYANPWVRRYFIHNALYWLEEFHFDGLRFDAAHAIADPCRPDILEELAEAVAKGPGFERQIYLVLENDDNAARYLRPALKRGRGGFDAQWNDDFHHALHVLLTGETQGYFRDFGDRPLHHLGRCLTEGFAFQGEASAYRNGKPRGESTAGLPLGAFVTFLQNHDQIGNRCLGERITALCADDAVRAATAILLLSPPIPLLFMGQEWASAQPFPYFVDFPEALAESVSAGRRKEFAAFPEFADPALLAKMPEPNALETFRSAVLRWEEIALQPHREALNFHRELLGIRKREIMPRLIGLRETGAAYRLLADRALEVRWPLKSGETLVLTANLGVTEVIVDACADGRTLYATTSDTPINLKKGRLAPWSVLFCLEERHDDGTGRVPADASGI